jgi:tetratricopeptide (TPR) repeat protein
VPVFLPLILAGLISQQPETLSLLKEPLFAPPVPKKERVRLEGELADAQKAAREGLTADNALRLARVQRALGRIGDALETLTRALEAQGGDVPAVHLERGRGFILIRKFDLAERELRKSDDALPEAHCDVAFTLYLQAEYTESKEEFGKCATPPVFAALAARRAGASTGPVTSPQSTDKTDKNDLTATYLTAVDRLIAHDVDGARDLLKPLVDKHLDRWMEPVYIAAEADYARIALPAKKKKKK